MDVNDFPHEFPHEFSLRYQVHVLCMHTEAVLKFAAEIAEEGPDNLSEDDMAIFDHLSDYLDRASYAAHKHKKRARRK